MSLSLGSIDFLAGLGVKDLPSGVTESCDENGVVAWEVSKNARILASLADVLRRGYVRNGGPDFVPPTTFGGDYSFEVRMRLWEEAATFLIILDGYGSERLRFGAGQDGVFVRFQNNARLAPDIDVRVSSVNVTAPGFTRLSFNFVGGQLQLKVNCSLPAVVFPLFPAIDTAAGRAFPVRGSLVGLGRAGVTGFVVSFLSFLFLFFPFLSHSRLLLRSKR